MLHGLDTMELLHEELQEWPMLTFWYGIGPADLTVMPRALRMLYIKKLPDLLDHYQQLHSMAAVYPYLDADQRTAIFARSSVVSTEHKPVAKVPMAQYLNELQNLALAGYVINLEQSNVPVGTSQQLLATLKQKVTGAA